MVALRALLGCNFLSRIASALQGSRQAGLWGLQGRGVGRRLILLPRAKRLGQRLVQAVVAGDLLLYDFHHHIHVQRFADVVIHARFQAGLAVRLHSVGCHGNDG